MGNAESTTSNGGHATSNNRGDKKKRQSHGSSSRHVASSSSTRHHKKSSASNSNALGQGVRDLQARLSKKLDDQDHPAAQFIDSLCSPYLGGGGGGNNDSNANDSYYSQEDDDDEDSGSDDDDLDYDEDETTATEEDRRNRRNKRRSDKKKQSASSSKNHRNGRRSSRQYANDDTSMEASSYSMDDGESEKEKIDAVSSVDDDDTTTRNGSPVLLDDNGVAFSRQQHQAPQPLASAFAKRCFFTKQGIGSHTQHYEGLTLTGNVILMLAAAMKLKGCPTICDEDLRRVEQTYPNQFSRLPDELLLSSGWRRISKFCHFSNKAIPDGVSFFHSKQRLHPSGGYYFLLAAAVGMIRPIDVEPLNRDTLVLLETDFPDACDKAPRVLVEEPAQWTLVEKFCFFSGGPINTEEDVYYQADCEGDVIYMLAFLSPSLTPTELYKLESPEGFKSVDAVEDVEAVYDLTDRDFDDLKLYHLGPCRALPDYVLLPESWTKVLPPHFIAAREQALIRAMEYEQELGLGSGDPMSEAQYRSMDYDQSQQHNVYHGNMNGDFGVVDDGNPDYDDSQQPDSLGATFDHLSQSAFRGVSHVGNTHQQVAQAEEHYNDSMQYTEDSAHCPDPQHDASSPTNDSSAFARLAAYSDDGEDEQESPLDEASVGHAHQRGVRLDPPDGEPPSLSKSDEAAIYALNGMMSNSMSHEQSFEQQDFPHQAYDDSNNAHFNYGGFDDHSRAEHLVYKDDDDQYYEQHAHQLGANDHLYRETDANSFLPSDGLEGFDSAGQSASPDKSLFQARQANLPPVSPRNEAYFVSSAAIKAQEVLQRNRKPPKDTLSPTSTGDSGDPGFTLRTADSESNGTWASGSDFTGDSSTWTDGSSMPPDRTSRRALILQMAKARMKKDTPDKLSQEEKKVDSSVADTSDFDLVVDLD